MEILTEKGVKFYLDRLDKSPVLLLSGINLLNETEFYNKKNIKKIHISKYHGFLPDDLNILDHFPETEELYVQNDFDNFEGVYYLAKLRKLNVAYLSKSVQLLNFPLLEEASIMWNIKSTDFSNNINLKSLTIWNFNPKSKCFKGVAFPPGLSELIINTSTIISLEGLICKNLSKFEGHYLTKLLSLNGLENIYSSIETLIMSHCKKIHEYDILSNCTGIKKIILSSCGSIESLKFIETMQNLEFLSFVGTTIIDGDLSYCKKLKYTGFDDKKHYSFTMKQMKYINEKNA